MVRRTLKKSRGSSGASSGFGGFPSGLASKIPFFNRRNWQSLDDTTSSRSPPPSYLEKAGARAPSLEAFWGAEKMQFQQPQQQPSQLPPQLSLQLPPQLPPLQGPQQGWIQNTSDVALPELGSLPAINVQQPVSSNVPGNQYSRPSITVITNMPPYTHQPQESFSSTNAAHFGAILRNGNTTASPLQTSVSPSSYYSQAVRNQQANGPYNALYRQPSKAISEVSSLSSGFGDGEFMLPSSLVTPPPATATPASANASPQQFTAARFSWQPEWMSQPYAGPARQNSSSSNATGRNERRETVYTTTSEDQPARFRSVTSWVDQQTGRIRRAQQRAQDEESPAVQVPGNPGIPGIHNPPSEPSFGMMMDDEEKPRRVEDLLGKTA